VSFEPDGFLSKHLTAKAAKDAKLFGFCFPEKSLRPWRPLRCGIETVCR
jgi:hypothetical protein